MHIKKYFKICSPANVVYFEVDNQFCSIPKFNLCKFTLNFNFLPLFVYRQLFNEITVESVKQRETIRAFFLKHTLEKVCDVKIILL